MGAPCGRGRGGAARRRPSELGSLSGSVEDRECAFLSYDVEAGSTRRVWMQRAGGMAWNICAAHGMPAVLSLSGDTCASGAASPPRLPPAPAATAAGVEDRSATLASSPLSFSCIASTRAGMGWTERLERTCVGAGAIPRDRAYSL